MPRRLKTLFDGDGFESIHLCTGGYKFLLEGHGYVDANWLRRIAREIDRQNALWEEEVNSDLAKQHDKMMKGLRDIGGKELSIEIEPQPTGQELSQTYQQQIVRAAIKWRYNNDGPVPEGLMVFKVYDGTLEDKLLQLAGLRFCLDEESVNYQPQVIVIWDYDSVKVVDSERATR